MSLRILSIQHDRQGLSEVERVASGSDGVAAQLSSLAEVAGAIVLSTCNRVEVLIHTDGEIPTHCLRGVIGQRFEPEPDWDLYIGEAALRHLFRVAAGLDSMVVGEREIAGQLRRALADAQRAGTSSLPLAIVVEEALRTSRQIANQTALEGAGRSVVSRGLDLTTMQDWAATSVSILGTGSYAGAVVAALRTRGVTDIRVHSASGRAAAFAASHQVQVAPSLEDALDSDLVVTCRGLGTPAVLAQDVHRPTTFLDLSLRADVDPAVGQLLGVEVITLHDIQAAISGTFAEDTARAIALIDQGVANTLTKLRSRIVDPAVVDLRESVMAMVEDEVRSLPQRPLTTEDAAQALRRLATRVLHIPSTRARAAAEQDRTDAYLVAMHELYGVALPIGPDADETERCPVTGLRICDLVTPKPTINAEEAM